MSTESYRELVTRSSIFAALADPGRLAIVDRLRDGDASPSEIQQRLSMPSNLVAHHLRVLESAGLLSRVRSEGDRRRTYLSLDSGVLETVTPIQTRRARRVLFVCGTNAARSQLAAALWSRHCRVPAVSAGTCPDGEVHPGAVAAARRHDLPMKPGTPRHINDVLADDDLVIVVCDNAHETLPADLARMHWSIPDPVSAARPAAFDRTIHDLTQRISHLAPRVMQA